MDPETDTPTATVRWTTGPEVLVRTLPDGVLLLSPALAEPVALRGPFASVWDLLADPRSLSEVVEILGLAFGAEPERVARDMAPAWEQLVAAELVVPTSAP